MLEESSRKNEKKLSIKRDSNCLQNTQLHPYFTLQNLKRKRYLKMGKYEISGGI